MLLKPTNYKCYDTLSIQCNDKIIRFMSENDIQVLVQKNDNEKYY